MSEDYHLKVDENVAKFGFHITFVMEDENGPSFCYSTGLYKSYQIPEVFLSGLPQSLSFSLVADYAKKYKENILEVNKKINSFSEDFDFPVYFIEVEEEKLKDYDYASQHFYGNENYKCVQLIYPDTTGKFPNEPGYLYNQEILGKLIE